MNGRKLTGAQPFPAFQALIDEELRKAEELVRGGTPASQVYAKIMERAATAPVYVPGTAPARVRPGPPRSRPRRSPPPSPRPSTARCRSAPTIRPAARRTRS